MASSNLPSRANAEAVRSGFSPVTTGAIVLPPDPHTSSEEARLHDARLDRERAGTWSYSGPPVINARPIGGAGPGA